MRLKPYEPTKREKEIIETGIWAWWSQRDIGYPSWKFIMHEARLPNYTWEKDIATDKPIPYGTICRSSHFSSMMEITYDGSKWFVESGHVYVEDKNATE